MNDKTHTDIDGQNGYKDLIPLDVHMNGGMKYTYEVEFGVVHEGWQNPYRYNARYAVLIGGGDTESSKNYPAYWKDTKSMYNNLVNNYNYRAGNVYLHFWDHKKGYKEGLYIDGPASPSIPENCQNTWGLGIENSLTILQSKMTKNDFLVMCVFAHGAGATFEVCTLHLNQEDGTLTYLGSHLERYTELDVGLNYARSVFIITACESGTAIYGTDNHPEENLQGEDRIIITSSDKNEDTWTEVGSNNNHAAFLYEGCVSDIWGKTYHSGFLKNMGNLWSPHSVYHAYEKGYDAATHNRKIIGIGIEITSEHYESTPQIYNDDLAKHTYW